MKRLRLGIILIIVSWLPIAQLCIYIAQHNGHLTSNDSAEKFRLAVWGIQILIGLVGVWLAGKVAIDAAHKEGWKRVPANLWRLFKDGGDGNNG